MSKFAPYHLLCVVTCELPRQETDHLVTTHTPTQVTTGSSCYKNQQKNHVMDCVVSFGQN